MDARVIAIDLYNFAETGGVCCTLNANTGQSANHSGPSVMIVIGDANDGRSNCRRVYGGGQGAKARSIAWHCDGTTPTLKSSPSGGNTVPDIVYEAAVFNESGKGYWMEGFGLLRAEGENRPSRPTHVLVFKERAGKPGGAKGY